jgi:hypothetical protein
MMVLSSIGPFKFYQIHLEIPEIFSDFAKYINKSNIHIHNTMKAITFALFALTFLTYVSGRTLKVTVPIRNAIVARHNLYRTKHCTPKLVWNDVVATSAAGWASKCKFQHNPAKKYGENLFMEGKVDKNLTNVVVLGVDAWYSEVKNINWKAIAWSQKTGHVMQLLWNSTRQVGCAIQYCGNKWTFFVCEYNPPGNYLGREKQNVRPPCK